MNFLKYVIREGGVRVTDFDQYESRGDNALRILEEMVRRAPAVFEGRSGTMYFHDHPPDHLESRDGELNFCSTKWRGTPSRFFPMPCPNSLGWPHVGIPDGDALTRSLLSFNPETISNKIFWIGANTHWTRVRLCEMSREFPDQIQATMMWWGREQGRVELNPVGGFATIQEHASHKYLIDCAGNGYSGRLRWLLATGRPVFIVDRRCVEHWHESLEPWKHFVPVREDLADLLGARRVLEENRYLYDAIGREARAFVEKRLVFDREIELNLRTVSGAVPNPPGPAADAFDWRSARGA